MAYIYTTCQQQGDSHTAADPGISVSRWHLQSRQLALQKVLRAACCCSSRQLGGWFLVLGVWHGSPAA